MAVQILDGSHPISPNIDSIDIQLRDSEHRHFLAPFIKFAYKSTVLEENTLDSTHL